MVGEIHFPNVLLETQLIDFGCILNNTEVVHQIKMTNTSPLEVNYKWKFLLEKNNVVNYFDYSEKHHNNLKNEFLNNSEINLNYQNNFDAEKNNASFDEDTKEINTKLKETTENDNNEYISGQIKLDAKVNKQEELLDKVNDQNIPNIEEIFDISPIYGNLHPGETQKLSITFYGHKEIKAYVRALCEIKNGPEYELLLKGEASFLNYELSNTFIDFGCIVRTKIKL